MADVHETLDELVAMVESARAMPMSASCVVNRAEVLARLEAVRAGLPGEIDAAQQVLTDRAGVIAAGEREAAEIIEAAKAERSRLVSRTEVVREATREAERLVTTAHADAERMRAEVDDYVDSKLANFEVVLSKTLSAVAKGRQKISDRQGAVVDDEDDLPLPGEEL